MSTNALYIRPARSFFDGQFHMLKGPSNPVISPLDGKVISKVHFSDLPRLDSTGKSAVPFWTKLKKITTKWHPEAWTDWMS